MLRKKSLLFLVFAILLSSVVKGQVSGTSVDGAKISFDKTEHLFGEIAQFSVAECKFTFTNTGNKTLVISNVKASCSCTKPEVSKKTVLPGESAYIQVGYNTGELGSFSKTVTVISNAVDQPRIALKIKGRVGEMYKKEKRDGKWGIVDKNEKITVPFVYDTIGLTDRKGFMVAQKSGKLGVIDYHNHVIIPFVYSVINLYGKTSVLIFDEDGYMQAMKNGKWGIVDKNNNVIIPFEYDSQFYPGDDLEGAMLGVQRSFANNGHACVKKNDKYVVINKNNKIIGAL